MIISINFLSVLLILYKFFQLLGAFIAMKGSINSRLVFILGVFVCCARALPADVSVPNCGNVRSVFAAKNMSISIPEAAVNGNSLSVCKADLSCCTPDMEMNFKLLVKKEYQTLLQHNVQSVQGILTSTASLFQDYVNEMLQKAEKKTLQVVNSTFNGVSDKAVKTFFSEVYQYVNNGSASSILTDMARSVSSYPDNRLAQITNSLFVHMFPLLYQTTLDQRQRELHPEYRTCLQERIGEMKPFGDITTGLERDVSKTFEATRVLIASLNFGAQMLNQSNQLILSTFSSQACYDALLRMTYCNQCGGHGDNIKPCSGYCLNVMRGCLSAPASEMDSSWNGFYEALEKLISMLNRGQSTLCLEDLLRSLHSRIAEASLQFSERHLSVHNKAKFVCGSVRWLNESADTDSNVDQKETYGVIPGVVVTTVQGSYPEWKLDEDNVNFKSSLLTKKIHQFKESVAKSRSFYGNLADTLCADNNFAEQRQNVACWNGQRVSEYTKTVLMVSVGSQKYNPEVPWVSQAYTDPRISNLTEKLRYVKQLVLSQVVSSPESDSLYHMNDYGSGSGAGPVPHHSSHDNNDDEDSEQDSANYSGSGDDSLPVTNVPDDNRDNYDPGSKPNEVLTTADGNNQTETKGAGSRLTLNGVLVCLSIMLAAHRQTLS